MGFRLALTAILAAFLGSAPCGAAEEPALEIQQRIKAAFLYKFASYVEWPANAFQGPESPIVIGVVGADAISQELERAVAGRKVGGRSMQVVRVASGEAAGQCCQILFIGSGQQPRAAEWLAHAQGRPVLTVTDAAVHPKGSVINFVAEADRIRFDIFREAAERNGLQLRSQLLSVARQVASP
jgi:hypothetical protein